MFRAIVKEKYWLIGLILIIASVSMLYWKPVIPNNFSDNMGLFFINYSICGFYFVLLLLEGRLKRGHNGLTCLFAFLVLGFISCYSLNREINIFEQPTGWWIVVQAVCCINLLSTAMFGYMPVWLRQVVMGIAGISILVFGYLSLYLVPGYPFSLVGSIVLGISLHTFIPLLLFIYTLVFLIRAGAGNRHLYIGFFSGMGAGLVAVTVFLIRWHAVAVNIDGHYNARDRQGSLPAWVYAAEYCTPGPILEKVLKTSIVYTKADPDNELSFVPRRSFGMEMKHDPLVILATMMMGDISVPEPERIKMLKAIYDARNETQERLWRSDALYTSRIRTTVELWPGQHLSYTEKQVTVTHASSKNNWNNQEALYSFHLPEGAVVSSLSLWINGKEEKGVLTSKGKADTAYHEIVGYERRDPSVVHWQEGNTVTVRVFPVAAGESRQFKIGITSPLTQLDHQLLYQNIYCEGPDLSSARETIDIHSSVSMEELDLPYFLIPGVSETERSSRSIHFEGHYAGDWAFRLRDKGIAPSNFYFGGHRYWVAPYRPAPQPADLSTLYLDIDRSWDKDSFLNILSYGRNRRVMIATPENRLVQVTTANADSLYQLCHERAFSLFPFYSIEDPSKALVITGHTGVSPYPGELDAAGAFSGKLTDCFRRGNTVRLFSIGNELSPYLQALRDCQVLNCQQGDLASLQDLLEQNRFNVLPETEDRVVVASAGLMIGREATEGPQTSAGPQASDDKQTVSGPMENTAPDHVMRLFAYRHIMRATGKALAGQLDPEPAAELLRDAQEAHIVTPVSSLIVLETQEDYKRFNIQDSKNGLKNATLHTKGAVPEPGEWALIIAVVLVLLTVTIRRQRNSAKVNA